ncbi:alpha/beta fold hydrolase [Alienimonas sp. DA493]|uniref:alpha/beta fold hydrolase n=1 Tax=Alienimonas sp. DA493 TaxID=3373605 RepID=UPI003754E25A
MGAETERVLIAIHSTGYDAIQYHRHALEAVERGADPRTTRVIAPQFFARDGIDGPIPDGMLHWKVTPYFGSSLATVGPDGPDATYSAYRVLDNLLSYLCEPGRLPALEEIVIAGHSAGGQMAQRYALVGRFESPPGVHLRFVASAPSHFAYPTPKRWINGSSRVPTARELQAAPTYNHWGYGLEEPYRYFRGASVDMLIARYPTRDVRYVCGALDRDVRDRSLSKAPPAMAQGTDRVERPKKFFAVLRDVYGKEIERSHRLEIPRGVAHRGWDALLTREGLACLFEPSPEEREDGA